MKWPRNCPRCAIQRLLTKAEARAAEEKRAIRERISYYERAIAELEAMRRAFRGE